MHDAFQAVVDNLGLTAATQHPSPDVEGALKGCGFERGSNGNYSSASRPWQLDHGYNDVYDAIFTIGTSNEPRKASFEFGQNSYILWAWKGNYLNLGAGAEIGFYTQPGLLKNAGIQWNANRYGYIPKMSISLSRRSGNGGAIVDFAPKIEQVWVAQWNPNVQGETADDLVATMTADFVDNPGMFEALRNSNDVRGDRHWFFPPNSKMAQLQFRRKRRVR